MMGLPFADIYRYYSLVERRSIEAVLLRRFLGFAGAFAVGGTRKIFVKKRSGSRAIASSIIRSCPSTLVINGKFREPL
jgi:hypothetical protein